MKYAESLRKNVRRVHELEFIVQKFQKVAIASESFDKQFLKLETEVQAQKVIFQDDILGIKKYMHEDIPDMMENQKFELEGWKRWFERI